MANAADAVYLYNGNILYNIQNVSFDPEDMASDRMRGINATKKAFGWRHAQSPGVDFSFETVIEADGPEVDWKALRDAKTEFTFSEQGDAWTYNYIQCVVQSIRSATDENGAVTWTVNCASLYEVKE
jgi:hypothetical protein